MKASSLFAVTVAGLLGLGAVAGAKYAGLFDTPEPKVEPKPSTKILVAAQNLFEGVTVTSSQVRLRELTADELAHYQKNKERYMPALVAAAHMRVTNKSIEADTPLLKEHFQDIELPEDVSRRMNRHMRAVNVSLPKERCSGGLLHVGEYVDVFVTSHIAGLSETNPGIQTACLARGVKIIVKRNNLWTTLVSQPGDLPINFTLMANPYRAALIEYAKTVGNLTLMPAPIPYDEQVRRESNVQPTFSDPNSAEYRDEDDRVKKLQAGELVVGSQDLERVFKLPALLGPQPIKQDTIVHYRGVNQSHVTVLRGGEVLTGAHSTRSGEDYLETPYGGGGVPGSLLATTGTGSLVPPSYRFSKPDSPIPATTRGTEDCPECAAAAAAEGKTAARRP